MPTGRGGYMRDSSGRRLDETVLATKIADVLPMALHAPSVPTPTVLIDAVAAEDGLTWTANPSQAIWRGIHWVAFDGNRTGGITEGAAGQKCQIMKSTTPTVAASWSVAVEPFTDAAHSNNPVTSPLVHFQPCLAVIDDELWCFWNGADSYVSKLTSPTGKWTNYRWEFLADGTPVLSSTVNGAAVTGTLRLSYDGLTDYWLFAPNAPTILRDGTIAMPATFISETLDPNAPTAGPTSFRKTKFNAVLYSSNDGASWIMSERIPKFGNAEAPAWEPFVVEREDGLVQVFSRQNRGFLTADADALVVATSWNRLAFNAPVTTATEVPVTRGNATWGDGRAWMAHCDHPNLNLRAGVLAPEQRRNGALFVSRRGGNDWMPAIPFGDELRDCIYPQVIIEDDTAHVVFTSSLGRHSLLYVQIPLPTLTDTAYVYPRRLQEIATSGPLAVTNGWQFAPPTRVTSATSLSSANDVTMTAWIHTPEETAEAGGGGDSVIELRATGGLALLKTRGGSAAGISPVHPHEPELLHPIFIAATFNGTTGLITTLYGDGSSPLESITAYVKALSFGSNPANNETVTINGTTYTFKTAAAGGNDVQIGGTIAGTMTTLVAAINAGGVLSSSIAGATTVLVSRVNYASFTATGSAAVTVLTTIPWGGSATPIFGHPSTLTSVPAFAGTMYDARVYNSVLTEAQVRGVYNIKAATLGFAALTGSSAPPAATVTFDSTATTATFPDLAPTPQVAQAVTVDGRSCLQLNGEASGVVESPWQAETVTLRYKLGAIPTGTDKYVIATIGTRSNPLRVYIAGSAPTALMLENNQIGTVLDPTRWNAVELLVSETHVAVNGAAREQLAPGARLYLGNAFPEGLLAATKTITYDVPNQSIGEVKSRRIPLDPSILQTVAGNWAFTGTPTRGGNRIMDTSDLNSLVAPGEVLRSRLRVGRYYMAPGLIATTASAPTNNFAYAVPFPLSRAATLDRIGVYVTAAGEAGSKIRLGIYADDGAGYPGALLLDAGQVAADVAATAREITINQALAKQLIWVVLAVQSAPTTPPTVPACNATNPAVGFTDLSNTVQGNIRSYAVSGITGAFPATWPLGSEVTGNRAPLIALRASA